jgi:outer membrane biosynthesis protein TonB
VVEGSSLPPLKDNQRKYGLIALVMILAALGLWFALRAEEEPKTAEPPPAEPEPVVREQFEPPIEIPEEEELFPTDPVQEAEPEKPTRPAGPKYEECYGTLSAREILGTINGPPRRQVRSCYERRLKDDNLLQGSMELLLTIAPSGSVSDVRVSGTLDDPQVYACVKRAARAWKFPQPEGGCVRTSMPFVMTPKP